MALVGVPMSVDTWRPEVLRRALQAGATVINAADGMQSPEMWEVATEFDVPIVVPFLSGPNPRAMEMVERDPVEAIIEFFDARLRDADRYGLRHRCVLDPGTGFAPSNWPWEARYLYQKQVYSNLAAMRVFGLPLYIALPWKETAQHDELLEIVIRNQPEFGRVHYPAKVRSFERRIASAASSSSWVRAAICSSSVARWLRSSASRCCTRPSMALNPSIRAPISSRRDTGTRVE